MPSYKAALPAQTAGGATATTVIGAHSVTQYTSGGTVTRVVVTPPAGYTTVTGVATNNYTLTIRQLRAGSVVTASVATLTAVVGVNFVAETPVVIPLVTSAAAPSTFAQLDDVFDAQLVQNGAGLAVGAGLVVSVDVN